MLKISTDIEMDVDVDPIKVFSGLLEEHIKPGEYAYEKGGVFFKMENRFLSYNDVPISEEEFNYIKALERRIQDF